MKIKWTLSMYVYNLCNSDIDEIALVYHLHHSYHYLLPIKLNEISSKLILYSLMNSRANCECKLPPSPASR